MKNWASANLILNLKLQRRISAGYEIAQFSPPESVFSSENGVFRTLHEENEQTGKNHRNLFPNQALYQAEPQPVVPMKIGQF
jgi:hypothetical protein